MSGFFRCHPLLILLYYILAVVIMIWLGHPIIDLIIFCMGLGTYFTFMGVTKGMKMVGASALTAFFCIILNPLFNHRGRTLLFEIMDTRFTLEALVYGIHMAGILMASLLLFACFSRGMTAEKIMTLTGKRLPAFSLLFSMVLRLVPKAAKDFREMSSIHGNKWLAISSLIRMELEHSMERSIAMKDRYYGMKDRSSYYDKKFQTEDRILLLLILILFAGICLVSFTENRPVRFFPSLHIEKPSAGEVLLAGLYYGMPLWMWGKEELLWILSKRRISGIFIRDRQSQPFK